jgi:hypothetical protein
VKKKQGKYRENEVISNLNRKNDCKANSGIIAILDKKSPFRVNDLGNGSWGKIDYMVNHCGYKIVNVSQF